MNLSGDSNHDPSPAARGPRGGARLSDQDGRMLDALVEHRFDPAALESLSLEQSRRATAMVSLMRVLEDYPVEDADDTLVHATLARVDRHERQRAERMSLETVRSAQGRSVRPRWMRLPDFISVAAVMLIGTSIAWPLVSQLRQQSLDAGCSSNLRMVAQGLSHYAGDSNGAMPVSTAGFGGWETGRNFDNLAPLISHGYCDENHLNCPGHADHPGPSYSYQLQIPGQRQTWGTGQLRIVMADRNPLIDAFWAKESAPTLSLSLNHAQRGQNAIQGDGSVAWLTVPRIVDDNIWLPEGVIFLQRGDVPHAPGDVFLAH